MTTRGATAFSIVAALFCTLALLTSSYSHAQEPPTDSVSLPIKTQGDLLFIPVSVGDEAQFILDTGGGINVISQRLLERVPHTAAGQFSGKTMRGELVSLPLYRIPLLQIGPLRLPSAVVGVWDVLDRYKLDGIISAKAFEKQPVELDFQADRVVFITAKSVTQLRRRGQVIPLRLRRQHKQSLDLLARFKIGKNATGRCEIDTGSPSATLDERYMPLLHIDKGQVKQENTTTLLGSQVVRYRGKIAAISLADDAQMSLWNPNVTFEHLIYDCVVGTDFWAGHRVILNLPKHEMIVDPQ